MTNTYSAQLLLPLSLQWVLYLEQRRHIKKTSVQTKQKYGPIYYCKRIEKCIQLFFESGSGVVVYSGSFLVWSRVFCQKKMHDRWILYKA